MWRRRWRIAFFLHALSVVNVLSLVSGFFILVFSAYFVLEVCAGVRVAMNSTTPPTVKKRKEFSVSDEVEVLRETEGVNNQAVVAKERGVARSTIATILKDKENIFKHQQESQLAASRKRLGLGDFQNIDATVLTWFKSVRAQNVPVSGPMGKKRCGSSLLFLKSPASVCLLAGSTVFVNETM